MLVMPGSRLGHHQPPFAGNVAGQGAPGHAAWLKLMTFGRGHVPTLNTKPAQEPVDLCGCGDPSRSCCKLILSGGTSSRQEPPESQPLPDQADEPDHTKYIISHNVYYVQASKPL